MYACLQMCQLLRGKEHITRSKKQGPMKRRVPMTFGFLQCRHIHGQQGTDGQRNPDHKTVINSEQFAQWQKCTTDQADLCSFLPDEGQVQPRKLPTIRRCTEKRHHKGVAPQTTISTIGQNSTAHSSYPRPRFRTLQHVDPL